MDDAALEVVSCGGAAHDLELNYSLAAAYLFSVPRTKIYDSIPFPHAVVIKLRHNTMVLLCYTLSTASDGVARC